MIILLVRIFFILEYASFAIAILRLISTLHLQPEKRSLIPWKTLNGQGVTIFRKWIVEGCCEKLGVLSWNIRHGTLNTESLTGRFMKIVNMLGRRRVDICFLQETKWKPICVSLIGSYKRQNDFWNTFSDAIRKISSSEIPLICGDLNSHVGDKANGFHGVHGGFDYGSQNEDGVWILEFAEMLNTYFKKRAEHLITYKIGMSCAQIDFIVFLKIHPDSRPTTNSAVHRFEAGKWVDDVICRLLTGEMAQWFKCSLSQNISMAIIYSAYTMRC
ncbi:hypothetical protein HELRODRAFT_172769 [Helobdella robusta]|uniref:Endonuclease/exonuclease/phosphatase domain-containing protein n=1 Tax=Helobdella robusta TaxID=6412 RepID=T1F5X1_HELRO|nr:hypothetical protein HELRODRAFT_172769 [Helobdella robusta]ESO04387.1 hypothetical protein HELRODRAFT_172769 [Helobdella robusta]